MGRLEPGCYYVLKPQRESTPHVATPAAEQVADWRAGLPHVALNPASVALVKMLKESLAAEPVEYFLAVGIDQHGSMTFEDWQQGDEVHCNVDVDRIVQRARESQSVGCVAYHNHITGEPYMSEPDKQLTTLLERKLAAAQITLLEHGIVPGHPDRIREAQAPRMLTNYERAVARDQQLWGRTPPPAVPWQRWSGSQRTTEAASPSNYPRDSFDVQSLTDALEEEARKILHSVPLDEARRIVQAVASRLGV